MAASLLPLEVFTMLGLGVLMIMIRIAVRIKSVGIKSLQLDDYLMVAAAVIYGLETGSAYIAMAWWDDLANNGIPSEQRKKLDPSSHEYYLRVGGSMTQLVSWSLYVLFLWTLKMSICVFYARLTAGLPEFQLRVKLGYFLILLTWLATQLCILLGCQPAFRDNWRVYPEPPNLCQPAISKLNLYVTVALNVASDAYLMSIPVPMLWRAHRVAPWRRLCLLAVFCAGVIVMACGIMRCYIVLKNPHTGALKAGTWACRESFLAVLTANAPVVYPTFRLTAHRVASTIFSGGHGGAASNSGFFPWRSTFSRKGRRSGGGGRMGDGNGGNNGGGGVMMPTTSTAGAGWTGPSNGSSVALGTWASCEASGGGKAVGGGSGGRERGDDVEAGCWGKAQQ